ncbi:TraG/TraD/VirD4 family protein [Rhodococcus erythropolis]|uniref:TraG/TraD/VirD4 family protein n=1 Tax=Rhodococcus erythropolis TaxID=1833 RepID=UPI002948C8EE|nr:TraG/TraD/VirD4 family protein [Rhodococcus erythropolis]MDV6277960.1 TraG/TraD/VirD4 family protein [Rhodococcus erythropolis]
MSLEGPDSAAPLTTALIGQVFEAASIASGRTRSTRIAGKVIGWLPLHLHRFLVESGGTFFSGGRLLVPLIAVLDEAANTVRLPELPDQYSHFGSRGIIPITILQNPEQGARVWGQEGLSSMTAGAVHYYGGNVKDKSYLADLIGTHEVATSTHSRGQGSTTTSQQWHEKPIFTTSELAVLTPMVLPVRMRFRLP